MKFWQTLLFISVLFVISALLFIAWEQRSLQTSPAARASQTDLVTLTTLFAGGEPAVTLPKPGTNTHEEFSGNDIAEGKRLYNWFNCHTCHANGGGDIGPALMDDTWIYGSEPRNIFAAIVEGRPNGMPSFRGKIPDAQVWQIVAYVRSMSAQVPLYARPGRNDDMQSKPAENTAPNQKPVPGGAPAADSRTRTQ